MSFEDILTNQLNVSQIDLEKAKTYQQKYGGRIEKLLVNMGSLSETDLVRYYQTALTIPSYDGQFSVEVLNENHFPPGIDLPALIHSGWLPVFIGPNHANVVSFDPLDWGASQHLMSLGVEFELFVVDKDRFHQLSSPFEVNANSQDEEVTLTDFEEDKLRELASEAPTVNLLNSLITKGVQLGASDLHLEPINERFQIRYRIDGVLREDGMLPTSLQLPVISRIKILSNMDIAERRRPQDGKIETKVANVELDIRVSVLPLNDGESVVMRFLRKDAVKYDMSVLGLSKDIQANIIEDLKSTAGVILLTGPTGSGKTTSLYTFLNELNDERVKIITLEDPVEYQLDGVNQVQVNPSIGFDFAAGLRSIVRQDPDIIMVGEIRDKETAAIAMQSALTGHLVFSTVHTNDAPSAYTRLVDLGVEEFLLNAAIISIMAQRLVRKICPHCSQPHEEALELIRKYKLIELTGFESSQITLHKAHGCDQCSHSGYKGRMSIMEYLRCDEQIRNLPKDSYFIPQARAINRNNGNRTLLEDGLLKASLGLTTIDEVLRVCA